MKPEELYAIWAPPDSVWSPWVLPVPFAQLECPDITGIVELQQFTLDWLPGVGSRDLAIVVDLPGADAIHYGLALSDLGFRPVPVIDGSPGPDQRAPFSVDPSVRPGRALGLASVVDMSGLLRGLCNGAGRLLQTSLAHDAPPAFLLDSNRMGIGPNILETAYDNRWIVFPQDFPSARFLADRGIRRVVLVHDKFLTQPQDDLAHVLLRWQEHGIAIESKSARFGEAPVAIQVAKPSRFRSAWYRALAVLGLRRNDAGGFGGYPPASAGGG